MTPNNAKDPIDMVIPYTCGMSRNTAPVEVALVQGKNALGFSMPTNSFAVKCFTLTPLKQ